MHNGNLLVCRGIGNLKGCKHQVWLSCFDIIYSAIHSNGAEVLLLNMNKKQY